MITVSVLVALLGPEKALLAIGWLLFDALLVLTMVLILMEDK